MNYNEIVIGKVYGMNFPSPLANYNKEAYWKGIWEACIAIKLYPKSQTVTVITTDGLAYRVKPDESLRHWNLPLYQDKINKWNGFSKTFPTTSENTGRTITLTLTHIKENDFNVTWQS